MAAGGIFAQTVLLRQSQPADGFVGAGAILGIPQREKGCQPGFVFWRHLHPVLQGRFQRLQKCILGGAHRAKAVPAVIKIALLIVILPELRFVELIVQFRFFQIGYIKKTLE